MFLWANKAQFSEVALRHIDEDDITNVSMPSVHGTDDDAGKSLLVWEAEMKVKAVYDSSDLEGITAVGEPEYQDIYTTPDQLAEDMMTLSLVPRSKWQTLLNLDTIRVSHASTNSLTLLTILNCYRCETNRRMHPRRRSRRRSFCRQSQILTMAWARDLISLGKRLTMMPAENKTFRRLLLKATLQSGWAKKTRMADVSALA